MDQVSSELGPGFFHFCGTLGQSPEVGPKDSEIRMTLCTVCHSRALPMLALPTIFRKLEQQEKQARKTWEESLKRAEIEPKRTQYSIFVEMMRVKRYTTI